MAQIDGEIPLVLNKRQPNGNLSTTRMLYSSLGRAAIGAVCLTTKSLKGSSTDDTLGERAIQALLLGGYLNPDLRRWLKTLASVELANRGLSDEAIFSIGAAIDASCITDPESFERQAELKYARREHLRSFAFGMVLYSDPCLVALWMFCL